MSEQRAAWDRRVAEIRAEYDKTKQWPPDPAALTAMSRAFTELGPAPDSGHLIAQSRRSQPAPELDQDQIVQAVEEFRASQPDPE